MCISLGVYFILLFCWCMCITHQKMVCYQKIYHQYHPESYILWWLASVSNSRRYRPPTVMPSIQFCIISFTSLKAFWFAMMLLVHEHQDPTQSMHVDIVHQLQVSVANELCGIFFSFIVKTFLMVMMLFFLFSLVRYSYTSSFFI